MIRIDDGFMFGLGAFETIAVDGGQAELVEWHVERLMEALAFMEIDANEADALREIDGALANPSLERGRYALKLVVTAQNLFAQTRPSPYGAKDYERGFTLRTSAIRRNETSPFTYRKTLNYGENISEKRRAQAAGFDEPLFLNAKGEVAEGATTNIFFVRGRELVTPPVESGLLPGVMRRYLLENLDVCERVVRPAEISSFDSVFVTNSLVGAMPVCSLDTCAFPACLPDEVRNLFPIGRQGMRCVDQ